jgi:hypothetical protein
MNIYFTIAQNLKRCSDVRVEEGETEVEAVADFGAEVS